MKFSYGTAIALIAISLSACDSVPVTMPHVLPNQPRLDSSTLPTGAEVQQANELLQRGQRREAAKAYFNAAQKYNSPDQERLVLQAAELAALINDTGLTQTYTATLGNRHLNPQNEARYRYIQGLMALSDANYTEALRLLPTNANELPTGLRQKILNARMRAAQSSRNRIDLANELVFQEPNLKPHEIALNHQRLWNQISLLSDAEMSIARVQVTHPIMRGWLDLNFLQRISLQNMEQLKRNITKWRQNFPNHPATKKAQSMIKQPTTTPTPVATKTTPAVPSNVKRVAAILPLSGPLADVGQSLLNGIKKAQRDHAPDIEIMTYDSNKGDINATYRKAISRGTDFVIGPFKKSKLTQLSNVSHLPVNTLGLNYINQSNAPTGLYQFGLLPEDEAAQVALKVLANGHKNVAIVAPNSSWGKRLRNTFGNSFTRNGGKVTLTINYADNGYQDIATALAKKKNRIDAVFLAASPSQARTIQPIIHKGALSSLPIYSTSHIYSGLSNPYRNVELEGITYTEIPWILEVAKLGLPQDSKFPRLRALGMDALIVAKDMSNLKKGSALNGRTGRIQLNRDGSLHRQLKWAKFNGGSPVPLSD